MDIKQMITIVKSTNHNEAYTALKELIELNKLNNEVYQYFDEFVDMMNDNTNSFIRSRGISLIAHSARWDNDNKVNQIIDQWLEHFEDIKPVVSRLCIQEAFLIAKYKPELIQTILSALENNNTIYKDSMQPLIYKDRQKAIRQIRQYEY